MINSKYFITIVLVLAGFVLIAEPVNYSSKLLQKDLSKIWQTGIEDMHELAELSDQLIGEGKFFKIKDKGYVFVGRVISCREGGCTAKRTVPAEGSYEYFDAYIIYDSNKVIQSVRVFNYQATHGHEITSKGWLKQFIGFNGEKPNEVGKQVDAISGATISVYAITDEVNYITELLKNHN